MLLAIRPPAVGALRRNEKKELWLLTPIRLASHSRSVHGLDLFRALHNPIFAANCYKTVTALAGTPSLSVRCRTNPRLRALACPEPRLSSASDRIASDEPVQRPAAYP